MAKDKSETKDEPKAEPRDKARDEELAAQLAVIEAVFAVSHGKDGEPIPIVPPEPEAEA
jgi:hypothetical protein